MLGCEDIHAYPFYAQTSVPCWEEEREALQAEFDEARRQWQALMDSNKENADLVQKAKAESQALLDKEATIKKKRELWASSRPWRALPYNPKGSKSRAALEAEWNTKYPRLSFAYSGRQLPQPQDFDKVLDDYFTDSERHGHHLLAYLEQGYGSFSFGGYMNQPSHPFMTKESLKRIHGRQCMHVGTSSE
jgi:hypothetical protein